MDIAIKDLESGDRAGLAAMLARVKEFDLEDVTLALELADIYLDQPEQEDYVILVAVDQKDGLVGFLCYGPTPLTEGTYDLYWIAVDPAWTGKGMGTRLLAEMEEKLSGLGARLVLIETSSHPRYEMTRKFYLKNGYHLVETIPDFYHDGEHRVTYGKRFRA